MKILNTRILGTGSYLPEKILTNDDIAKRVDTNHQWIVERTGIHTRRIGDHEKDETPSGMAARAALKALEAANLEPNDIDFIIFSTTLPDMFFPNTASVLQQKLGITNQCGCIDINAACTGWTYAVPMADAMIKAGMYKRILVIGSEMTSTFNNWDDRNTCILFGDGAGAVILGATESDESTIYSSTLTADSTKKDHLYMAAGGSAKRVTQEILDNNEQWLTMNGQEVFKAAVKTMASLSEKVIADANKSMEDVDWFIPHQANLRIIEAVGNRFKFPLEKVVVNVDKYANTSSATVPIALDEAIRDGRIKRGDNVLIAAFGAGLTAGAIFLKY